MKSGIYKIINDITNKCYIGSAINIDTRFRKHFETLRTNRHYNSYLQAAWNKYGEDKFKTEVLEYVEDKNKLIEREQYYLDIYNSYDRELGYNLSPTAGSPLGVKHSEEFKKKISIANKGKIISEETKIKMKETQLNKSNRNFKNWPHTLGQKCKCDECMEKKKQYGAKWRSENKNFHRKYYSNGKYIGVNNVQF